MRVWIEMEETKEVQYMITTCFQMNQFHNEPEPAKVHTFDYLDLEQKRVIIRVVLNIASIHSSQQENTREGPCHLRIITFNLLNSNCISICTDKRIPPTFGVPDYEQEGAMMFLFWFWIAPWFHLFILVATFLCLCSGFKVRQVS